MFKKHFWLILFCALLMFPLQGALIIIPYAFGGYAFGFEVV
jgi:hypothetical protein